MAYDDEEEDVDESGSSLRRKLEETLDKNRDLTTKLTGLTAKSLIEEHGHNLVKPEDLEGVDLSEMSDTAERLQQERSSQQADLARDMLARQGLAGDELDKAVTDFLSPEATGRGTAAHGRAREVAAIGGTAAPLVNPDALHGLDAIEFALGQKTSK